MSLTRWVPSPDGRRPAPRELGYETRLDEPALFDRWLYGATGQHASELEVVNRTLRMKDDPQTRPASVLSPEPAEEPAPSAPEISAAAPIAPAADPITEKVLGIVSEQTGYPPDMLDLELDLEADLGIDTVKQAETFAAVREAYDIPREENLELRQFPTLEHVVQFVRDRRPDLAAASAPAAAPTAASSAAAPLALDPITEDLLLALDPDIVDDWYMSSVTRSEIRDFISGKILRPRES